MTKQETTKLFTADHAYLEQAGTGLPSADKNTPESSMPATATFESCTQL